MTGRMYEVFVAGTHDHIAVFGPESPRNQAFHAATGTSRISTISTGSDLLLLANEIPLVLLPLWWKESTSAAVIAAARSTKRQILTAFLL